MLWWSGAKARGGIGFLSALSAAGLAKSHVGKHDLTVHSLTFVYKKLIHDTVDGQIQCTVGSVSSIVFWSILNSIILKLWQFLRSAVLSLASQHLGDSRCLILSPRSPIWVWFRPISIVF